jgi:hypothetical protein
MLIKVVAVVNMSLEDAFSIVTVGCGGGSGNRGKEMVINCGGSGRQGACCMVSKS